ncbi:MAG: V-type ATP synthase subunit F [Thermoplasmata archaeon]
MSKIQEDGKIAVIGERALALGFRLIGLEHSYVYESGAEGVNKFLELYKSNEYSLIMLSESLKQYMDKRLIESIELSTKPLVVFIPLLKTGEEESVSSLAKRILGVDIGR